MKLQTRPVSEIADQIRGVTYSKQDATKTALPGCVPVLRAGNITDAGLTFDDLVYVPSSKVSPKQRIKKNDIVIAASSGSLDVVGKAARALEDFSGGFGAFCKVLRPRSIVNAAFFSHYFKTPEYRRLISSLAAGANINNLRNGDLDDLQIPLPPLAEQKRIAAILDAADALRAKRREAIAQLDALLQSTFLTLFGDPVENPMGWERKKFSQIGNLDRGVSKHRPRNAPELLGGPYPLVQTGEVANCDTFIRDYKNTYSEIGLKQSKLWPVGTLCITIAANIAKTGILAFEACFPDSVVGFRAEDPATIHFAKTWLSFLQKMLEETAPESAQKNINLEILRNLEVPVPPLPLQQKFAAIVESVERQKTTQRAHLAELDALFAALQHRAFRGEL